MENQNEKSKRPVASTHDDNQGTHQDLAKENIGNEPQEQDKGDPNSPYKLKETLDDKRPEDSSIQKGWTVDSNTSRGPQDQKKASDNE